MLCRRLQIVVFRAWMRLYRQTYTDRFSSKTIFPAKQIASKGGRRLGPAFRQRAARVAGGFRDALSNH